MKDRLVTVAGGLLAFALAVMLLIPVQRDESGNVSKPLSSDRGRAGLQGLERWLQSGGVKTDRLRRRYTALAASLDLAPRGNLLIVTLPQQTPSRPDEREALRIWLAQGNTALVMVAGADAPGWTRFTDASSVDDFLDSLGFVLDAPDGPEDEKEDLEQDENEERAGEDDSQQASGWRERTNLEAWLDAEPVELLPRFAHPSTRDVSVVATRALRPLDLDWYLSGVESGRVVLPLLGEKERGAAFWEARVGGGRLWVSRYSDLFANAGLGEADNGRFMANLVGASLARNGRVIFDDMHQGATDLYDARAFFSDPRFFTTLAFMVGFWLLYLVGRSRRLAPARESVSRYYAADLARAMAGLFARRLSDATVEQQLFAFFFNDIRGRYGLPTNGQPVWSMLSGMSRISPSDVDGLRTHYERATAGRKSDLMALARLMRRTRENLL